VADAQIAERLESGRPSDVVCQQLVSDAINEGARDNTTVVVARFVPGDSSSKERTATAEIKPRNRIDATADGVAQPPLAKRTG
jgi:serine/threonine protein phosphatase PrpC